MMLTLPPVWLITPRPAPAKGAARPTRMPLVLVVPSPVTSSAPGPMFSVATPGSPGAPPPSGQPTTTSPTTCRSVSAAAKPSWITAVSALVGSPGSSSGVLHARSGPIARQFCGSFHAPVPVLLKKLICAAPATRATASTAAVTTKPGNIDGERLPIALLLRIVSPPRSGEVCAAGGGEREKCPDGSLGALTAERVLSGAY